MKLTASEAILAAAVIARRSSPVDLMRRTHRVDGWVAVELHCRIANDPALKHLVIRDGQLLDRRAIHELDVKGRILV